MARPRNPKAASRPDSGRAGSPANPRPARASAPAKPQRPAAPAKPVRPAWDDPNAYRSPGFQDQPQEPWRVDYDGLPRDEEAPEGETPAAAGPRPEQSRQGAPRGMYGRRPDRVGTDPDAYRSPGFSGTQRHGARPPTAAERLAAMGLTPAPSEPAADDDDSQAALLGRPHRRG
jgi:hypothetical protein